MTTVRTLEPTRYAKLLEVRRALNLDESRSRVDDSLLEDFIDVASRAVDNFCQRDFGPFDDEPSPRIYELYDDVRMLQTSYARGVSSQAQTDDFAPPTVDDPVVVEVSHLPVGHWYAIDDGSWWTDPISPVNEPAWAVNILGSQTRNFARITARWGWGPYIPTPISRAVIMLATRLYKRQDSPLGVTGVGELGQMIVRRDSDIYDLLKPYRSFNQKLP